MSLQHQNYTYNIPNQIPQPGYPASPAMPTMAHQQQPYPQQQQQQPVSHHPQQQHPQMWKQSSTSMTPANIQYTNAHGQYRYDSQMGPATTTAYPIQYGYIDSTGQQQLGIQNQVQWAAPPSSSHPSPPTIPNSPIPSSNLVTTPAPPANAVIPSIHHHHHPHIKQEHLQQQPQQSHHHHHHHQQPQPHIPHAMVLPASFISPIPASTTPSSSSIAHHQHTASYSNMRMPQDSDISNSIFQAFENTPPQEQHFLYCKKCALLKPAVEFASTTGFFNNNCKHCRNYRRKGEDAKSEPVQEIYRISSYEELNSTLEKCITSRRHSSAPLICVHFYLHPTFIGDRQLNESIDSPRYLTPEGRSMLANMLIKEVKSVDHYSYNHRSTRVFKSGETHKYLCSQSTALPWRQKKRGPNGEEISDPDLHNCSGTILVKFQSPGQSNQRVCVAYCHNVSHPPKTPKNK